MVRTPQEQLLLQNVQPVKMRVKLTDSSLVAGRNQIVIHREPACRG